MNKKIAIQDTYGERFQYCWGCGPKNEAGLHIKSYPTEDGKKVIARVKPGKAFTGGVPNNLFGGMIAMIFDCHGTASAAFYKHHAEGLDLTEDTVIERFITAHLEVDFKKPTPMDEEVEVEASLEELGERKAVVNMVLTCKDEVRAKAKIVAVAVKDNI